MSVPGSLLGPDRWHDDTVLVAVLDEHALARRRLVLGCEAHSDLEVVAEGPDSRVVSVHALSAGADVLVLPLAVQPDGGAAEITRVVHNRPQLAVLVLEEGQDDRPVLHCLLAGARGLLPRSTPVDDVVRAVRAVAAGRPVLPGRAAAVLSTYLRGPATYAGVQTDDATLAALDAWAADPSAALAAVRAPEPVGPHPAEWRRVAVALARAQRIARTVGLRATSNP